MTPPRQAARSGRAATRLPPLAELGLSRFLDSIEDGLQIWSPEGRLLYANPATYRLFEVPPEALLCTCGDLLSCCVDAAGDPVDHGNFSICALAASGEVAGETVLRVRVRGGGDRWLRIQAYFQHAADDRQVAGIISTSVDVTRFIEAEQDLQRQAQFDALTRLPNRVLFADRLHQSLATAQRRHEMLAVCMMDLDGFKPVNDRLGHKAGDRLLQEIAYRLENAIRADDTAARLGGDEFALLLGGFHSHAELDLVMHRILHEVARPVVIEGQSAAVSASIGVTLFPGDFSDPDQLLRHADQAMYKAKEDGKGRYHVFDPAVASKLKASRSLLKKIQEALDAGQFCLYYQPKVDCRQGRVVGLEALVRWRHPVLGLRAPSEFLPLIEHEDSIISLGEWVVGAALEQLGQWRAAGLMLPVSVNIAARQFLRGNFTVRLGELLERQPPEVARLLGIEIVETAVLDDVGMVSQMIQHYRAQGIKFDLDDFGTGYSSLVHLKRLEIDTLKIDQNFVHDMLDDPGDLTIVNGVINLANAFHLGVVAEGVEDIEHVLTLLELGCDVMQGYGIARPMPAERVADWVRDFRPDPRWRIADARFPQRSDFDLLLGKVLHRYWLQRLLQAAQDPAGGTVWPELDYRECRLARWYAEAGMKRFVGRPELLQFDIAHREVHRLGQAIHNEIMNDEPAREASIAALNAASASLVQAIETLQKLIVRT
ncbi:MAG: EAL domain-containing protein [Pseudomonadota bacterium]